MINDSVLFQHIYSNSDRLLWLSTTIRGTLEYCYEKRIEYRLITGHNEVAFDFQPETGHWAVPYTIREMMALGYRHIFYLDADAFIADPSHDLREACAPDTIGAVWHDLDKYDPALSHYSAGALYVTNTPKVREFIDDWIAEYPGAARWWEQGVFNRLGVELGVIRRLDNAWDAGYAAPSEHPIVRGLHGMSHRQTRIEEALKQAEE